MYTGQLEYWTSEQNALYKTAQKMNIDVLTKVLDAQLGTPTLTTTSPQTTPLPHPIVNERKIITLPSHQSSLLRKSSHQELPTTLPGRKLPIWRRKIDTPASSSSSTTTMNDSTTCYGKRKNQQTSGPSRFDLPEVEDFALGVFSSFDDITYNTKPIAQAQKQDKDESIDMSYNRSEIDNLKNDTTEDEDDDMKNEKSWENSDDDWSGPKGILRDPDVQASPAKRVRFELEEKENVEKKKKNSLNTGDSIDNHAKIIREVLKKYPHLVKNNKNIRLKIMQKEGKSNETNASSKTKVSYVVLKSDHLMAGNIDDNQTGEQSSGAGQQQQLLSLEPGEHGPWKCRKCNIDEEYKKYYMYRRHMQDVHNEKFDPRVCEHCGYKATKRNMLMYHLYTQHNIPPPKNMSFPKCHACNYVALSENLLVRHQINHNHRKVARSLEEVQCAQCHLTFKDVNDLACHEMSTGHGTIINGKEQKGYRCPHCSKLFVRPTNLQVHIDCAHRNLRENNDLLMENITLEPSSEAEALSTVASGIAASLGVGSDALIVDHHQQQHGIVTTADGEGGYLVPEIDINHLTQGASYNGHDIVEGQQMIMLIDNEAYQNQLEEHHQQQQPQQLEISSNEQLVMQGTDEGMIVYIADNEGRHEQAEHQVYETYQQIDNVNQQSDENNQVIEEEEEEEEEGEEEEEEVEEVFEEVEEVVEEVEEVVEEESNETMDNINEQEEGNDEDVGEQIEEEIHYVEETEIVEFDEEQGDNGEHQQGQSMMIIEEEHLESQEAPDDSNKQKQTSALVAEWDESSTEMNES